jgi:ACS family allantoate permease-like MFS transporter
MLESAVTPAMVIFTGQWYKAEEHLVRNVHDAHYSIEAWKVLFIVTGLIAIATGVLFFLGIPDYPSEAWILNDDESKLVVENKN